MATSIFTIARGTIGGSALATEPAAIVDDSVQVTGGATSGHGLVTWTADIQIAGGK